MDRESYQKEVEKISNHALERNPELKSMLDEAFTLSKKVESGEIVDHEEAQLLVLEILESFFKDPFSKNFSIPISFIESPLGKMLFGLKFGLPEVAYTTGEIIAIMGKTRALISHDCKNELVRYEKKGKNIYIYENDLIDYMISKGMSRNEAKKRIALFKKFKNEGYKAKEIQEKIKHIMLEEYQV